MACIKVVRMAPHHSFHSRRREKHDRAAQAPDLLESGEEHVEHSKPKTVPVLEPLINLD